MKNIFLQLLTEYITLTLHFQISNHYMYLNRIKKNNNIIIGTNYGTNSMTVT